MIEYARLSIEMQPTNPPKPTNIGVFMGDKRIALVELHHLKMIFAKLLEMEAAREKLMAKH
jgi:hypothetical protein